MLAIAAATVLALLAWLWTPDIDRAVLEARYARSSGDFVAVAGQRLHWRDSGPPGGPNAAPVLILLHGFGGSLHSWEPWAEALATQYRVIRYDQPGAGLSLPDTTGDYSDARALQLLLALMDQQGIARATIVGHSMGGRFAWRFAATHPERVDKLVLVAPDGFASPGFAYGKPPEVSALVELMRYSLPRPLLRMSLVPAYADPAQATDARVARYHELLLAPGARAAMLARMRQLVLEPPEPYLARISAPTLLLWGEQDRMIPIANAADYQRAMPRARLAAVPGAGHLPQEEAPMASLQVVREFLAE